MGFWACDEGEGFADTPPTPYPYGKKYEYKLISSLGVTMEYTINEYAGWGWEPVNLDGLNVLLRRPKP